MEQHLYIVFSSTQYRIGKMIRLLTQEAYNHVSISLDENFTQMYSFGRRYFRTPLYGGFVKESPARYYIGPEPANIQVCKIPVTQAQYDEISKQIAHLQQNKDQYLYNHPSALAALLHVRWNIKDAYTCVEFCVDTLSQLGLSVKPQFYSVDTLRTQLQEYVDYTGPMNRPGEDPAFFKKLPFWYVWSKTLKSWVALIPRMKRK